MAWYWFNYLTDRNLSRILILSSNSSLCHSFWNISYFRIFHYSVYLNLYQCRFWCNLQFWFCINAKNQTIYWCWHRIYFWKTERIFQQRKLRWIWFSVYIQRSYRIFNQSSCIRNQTLQNFWICCNYSFRSISWNRISVYDQRNCRIFCSYSSIRNSTLQSFWNCKDSSCKQICWFWITLYIQGCYRVYNYYHINRNSTLQSFWNCNNTLQRSLYIFCWWNRIYFWCSNSDQICSEIYWFWFTLYIQWSHRIFHKNTFIRDQTVQNFWFCVNTKNQTIYWFWNRVYFVKHCYHQDHYLQWFWFTLYTQECYTIQNRCFNINSSIQS